MTQDQETESPAVNEDSSTLSVFDRAMIEARGDLDATAAQVWAGAFSGDGIGHVGTLFRALRDQHDPVLSREQWSETLSLAAEAWHAGHHKESVQLLKDAQIRLSPPEEFQEHFRQSIEFGGEYIIFLRARKRFDDGETEEARDLLDGLSPETRAPLDEQIRILGDRRRKSRRRAFTIAGVMGSILAIACVYSAINLASFLRNPPGFNPENFDITRAFPDIELPAPPAQPVPAAGGMTPDASPAGPDAAMIPGMPDARPSTAPAPAGPAVPPEAPLPGIEGAPLAEGETDFPARPDFRIEDVFGPPADTAAPTAGTAEADATAPGRTGPSAPSPGPRSSTPDPLPDPAPAETGPAPTRTVPAPGRSGIETGAEDEALLERCALALRVSAAATRDAEGDTQARLAAEFQRKFLAACSDLPFGLEILKERAGQVDDARVMEMSENILRDT